MIRKLSRLFLVIIILLPVLNGCGGDGSHPVMPLSDRQAPELSVTRDNGNSHHPAGFFLISINKETLETDIARLRSGMWHFNLTGILNGTMGIGVQGVPAESDPANGLFVMDITLTHPFPESEQFAGFDVKGIMITPGTESLGGVTITSPSETRLENADGYTRWWNPVEFTNSGILGYTNGSYSNADAVSLTATVNPYKYYADVLDPESSMNTVVGENMFNPDGRGVFKAGSVNTRRYEIRFPMNPGPQVKFGYAVDVSWDTPDPNPPVDVPLDFPFVANQPEPYYIFIRPTDDTLYYDSESSTGGGVFRTDIYISDWQGQVNGNIADEILIARVHAPGFLSNPIQCTYESESSTAAKFVVDLTGKIIPTQAGPIQIVVEAVTNDGTTYEQTSAPAPSNPVSSYNVLTIDVPDPDCFVDENNNYNEAIQIGYNGHAEGQVCCTDDEFDYYFFEVSEWHQPKGELRVLCEDDSVVISVVTEASQPLAYANVTDGIGIVELDDLPILPGNIYIRIGGCGITGVVPYLLELDAYEVNIVPSSPDEVTPHDLFCKVEKIYRTYPHVIMTGLYGLWIYSMSDPSHPEITYYNDIQIGSDAFFWYPRLWYIQDNFMADSDINMINFSTPDAPAFHEGLISLLPPLGGLATDGEHLYIGRPNHPTIGVSVYDIHTDPLNPAEVTTIDFAAQPEMLRIIRPTESFRSLIVGYDNQLLSWDIDDVNNITHNCFEDLPFNSNLTDMDLNNYTIFCSLQNTVNDTGHLYMYEQDIAGNISDLGNITTAGDALYMSRWSQHAYIGDGDAGLSIIDVSDPGSMELKSSILLSADCRDIAVVGDEIDAIPKNCGMTVIDVSNDENPEIISELPVVNAPRVGAISGDYLYVADKSGYAGDIRVVDISNPSEAHVVEILEIGDAWRDMDARDDLLVALDLYTVHLIDITNPLDIHVAGNITLPSAGVCVELYGDTVYVGTASWNFRTYDISNPASPVPADTDFIGTDVFDIEVSNYYMYVANGDGVEVFHVAYPNTPESVGEYLTTEEVRKIVARWPYMHLITPSKFQNVSIANPAFPNFQGETNVGSISTLTELAVDGQFAYVQAPHSSAHILRLWPLDNPTYYNTAFDEYAPVAGDYPQDLIIDDGVLYGMNRHSGITIVDLY